MKILLKICLFLACASAVFAQNFAESEIYVNAQKKGDDNVRLHDEGRYSAAVEESPETNRLLDEALFQAFMELMSMRASESREKAENAVAAAKTSGATSLPETDALIVEAEDALKSAESSLEAAKSLTVENYEDSPFFQDAIDACNDAEELAKKAVSEYLSKRSKELKDEIDAAKKTFREYVAAKYVAATDDLAKKIDEELKSADQNLISRKFDDVEKNVSEANKLLAEIEKIAMNSLDEAKRQLDAAKKRFDAMKDAGTIAENSTEDATVAKLLKAADDGAKKLDLNATGKNVAAANAEMDAIEMTAGKQAAEVAALIEKAENSRNDAVAKNAFAADDETGEKVDSLIESAKSALDEGDFAAGRSDANDALAVIGGALAAKKDAAMLAEDDAKSDEKAADERAAKEKAEALLKQSKSALESASAATKATKEDAAALLAKAKARHQQLKDYRQWQAAFAPDSMKDGWDSANDEIHSEIGAGDAAFSQEDWVGTTLHAKAAIDAIDKFLADEKADFDEKFAYELDGEGRRTVLPRYYVVVARKPVSTTDCLWRIALFDFIYGDRHEWPRIFDLNSPTFAEPENPHLLLPNQILEIPAISGEKRSGFHSPDAKYAPSLIMPTKSE